MTVGVETVSVVRVGTVNAGGCGSGGTLTGSVVVTVVVVEGSETGTGVGVLTTFADELGLGAADDACGVVTTRGGDGDGAMLTAAALPETRARFTATESRTRL